MVTKIKDVSIDLPMVIKGSLAYLDHGETVFKDGTKRNAIKIRVYSDPEARFINLFGVSVDINSGNIALGLFPNPNEYVYCGNLYSKISKLWFGTKKLPNNIDMKYIVQLLKLDPVYYQDEIIKEVCFNLDSGSQSTTKSICVKIMRDRHKIGESKEQKTFISLSKGSDFISKTAKICIELCNKYEHIAQGYFQNFITEMYDEDIKKNIDKTLEQCFKARNSNLESLTIRYVEKGFPLVFLTALKSYGFSIKDRKALFNKHISISRYSSQDIEEIAVALSSLFYARNIVKREIVFAYNFMDLMRSIGWDQSIYFALDLVVKQKSKNMWQSLVNKFNIQDILRERKLSMKEFVLGIDTYRRTVSDRIDWGTCYNRVACMPQYKMLCYAPCQLEKAGRVFESSMSVLRKSLQLVKEG